MEVAMKKARRSGVGACAVRRGNHLGMVSWYVEPAARLGLVALALGNSPPAMAPPNARNALIGTNPIAAAFPTLHEPVVVDMATTVVSRGKIRQAQAEARPIPDGWALGADGLPTNDPDVALAGSLQPVGGAKGFALAILVEALSGVLAGSGVGPGVNGTFAPSDQSSDCGSLFLAFDPGAFGGGYAKRMTDLVELIRSADPISPELLPRAPGDRRYHDRAQRLADGIELPDVVLRDLEELGGPIGSDSSV
jgi:LDH2 family malate/lactate/ureidoglycolate dehydrogenase